LAADPKADFLFVTNEGDDNLAVYAIDTTTGALSPAAGSPVATGHVPLSVAVDPAGKFVYVTDAQSATVSGYSISGAGGLTPVPGSPFPAGTSPAALTVDPTGSFAYVTDYSQNQISAYSIAPSGALSSVSGSPFGPTGIEPSAIVVLGAIQ
jgi:DNA-binding beta-propeller fold protein YncE